MAASPGELAAAADAARAAIDAARDIAQIAAAARAIPQRLAAALDGATDVGPFTATVTALNDRATVRVIETLAREQGVNTEQVCWLVFGSQARGEQTLATDQDNGLIFQSDQPEADRPHWMQFGQRVNEALAACGYPLCDGRVMAGQPLCCLTVQEWSRRFGHWMAQGSGNDLFAARIYFDLRPLAGNLSMAGPLMEMLRSPAAAVPRFIKQMADIVLCNHVPLNWRGRVVTTAHQGQAMFDLKMHGTALFVDAARLWALALSLDEVGTVPRLLQAARALHVPDREAQSWVRGFLSLQRLRLDRQRMPGIESDPLERTWVSWAALSESQRDELRRALRAARLVQQRITLDYCR